MLMIIFSSIEQPKDNYIDINQLDQFQQHNCNYTQLLLTWAVIATVIIIQLQSINCNVN